MKRLIFLTVLFFFISKEIFSQNWNAVCAGINDYPGSGNDLSWCVNDATEMKYYLETYKLWFSNRVTRIINGDASETGIQTAMQNMSTSAGNTNLFHFSGHGDSQELGGSNGLIPANSLSDRITQNELQINFGTTYNQITAFLDVCGSGIFPRDMTKGIISSACKAEEYSWEDPSIEHGYFTYYLLDGLTKSNITTAEQLHSYAAPLTTQVMQSQHPQIGDRFGGYLSIYNAPYTLSGTLSHYETWSITSTLQGNVLIPSGILLTNTSNMNLNLNGYSIISSGGSIFLQSGAIINGMNAYSAYYSEYKGLFPSLETALNYVGNGQAVYVSNSQTIYNNITVPSSVNLSVGSNKTLTFASGKKLSIYGTLTANGATFQGNGFAGSWNSIWFAANSSGSIQGCTIKDAQCGVYATTNANVTLINNVITHNSIMGISALSGSIVNVTGCTISNNGTGINASSSKITIVGNHILNNTNYGIKANNIFSNSYNPLYWYDNTLQSNGYYGATIFLNNSTPYIYNNTISENGHGVVINSSTTTNFADPSNQWKGYNAITCATTPLFKAENYSVVYAGYGFDGGYNSIFGSELPDMEAINHSQIYACNNYWGSPNPAIYSDGTSTILAWYPLEEDPNPGSCEGYLLSKSISSNSSSNDEGDISVKYWEAIDNGKKGNLQKAKELLQLIIEGKFDEKYTPLALLSFYEFSLDDKSGLNNFLNEIYNRAKDDPLRPFAVRILARETALSNNYEKMISYNT